MDVYVHQPEGAEDAHGNLQFSRLEGGKRYHCMLAWDVSTKRIEFYMNGVLQSPIFILPQDIWEIAPNFSGEIVPSGYEGVDIVEGRLFEQFLEEEEVAELADSLGVAPMAGEGRTIYAEGLDLSGYDPELLYEADFDQTLNLIHEEDLFAGETRVREPEGKEWILEGVGRASAGDGWLTLEAETDPNDTTEWLTQGHLVIWLNREFPEDILIDYEMSPYDSGQGLNIVFFACRPNNGADSIFDLSMKKREGNFGSYLYHDLDNYHVSVWACPTAKRRTTNMRKNPGFSLTAIGNDHLTDQGPGPHRIRILRDGPTIKAETRGTICMEFEDDGVTYGALHRDGYIGIRMMAQSHSIKIRNLRVYGLGSRP